MRELPAVQIDADISRAWSIPAVFYTDPEVWARERDRIFARAWQVVGHREQLLKPGDFFTTDLLGEPLLLVRGVQSELRAFTTSAATAPDPPPRGADRAKFSAAAITAGLTASTER